MHLQGFKDDQFDLPHSAKLLGEGGSATIYQESLSGELRATKYPKKVSAFDIRCYCLLRCSSDHLPVFTTGSIADSDALNLSAHCNGWPLPVLCCL